MLIKCLYDKKLSSMNQYWKNLSIVLVLLFAYSMTQAQIVYGHRNWRLAIFDLADCSFCEKFSLPACGAPEVSVLTDGRVIWTCNSSGTVYDSLGNTIAGFSCPFEIQSTCLHNDTFYLGTSGGLYTLDLTSYQVTFIGDWAPGMPSRHGLYSLYGNLYSTNLSNLGGRPIWQVNIADPSASVFVQNMPNGTPQPRGVGSLDSLMYFASAPVPSTLWIYNQATNTVTQSCPYGMSGAFWGVSVLPAASAPIKCPCITSAGAIPGGPINICDSSNAVVNSAVGVVLQNNDILRYFLITDPLDIINSILAVSITPSFPFNPNSMSLNTTYYVVAGAGDNLNGNIDFDDPCLSFSNLIPVTWRSRPTVAFEIAGSPDICAGDCVNIDVIFTGTPSFTLTYTSPNGGSATQTFTSNTGMFEVCVPANAPNGGVAIQATALTDAFCTCN